MIDIHNTAIIVAAGTGSRMGSAQPKQFLNLAGKEVLSYSVASFLDHPRISQVIIVCSTAFVGVLQQRYPNCQVVVGGATRQESVGKGLKACPPETQNVLIHDAARPLVPMTVIDDCLEALKSFDGVAPAISPADSMVKLTADGFENLKRQDLRIVQTPQCFRSEILKKAHGSGIQDTDEIGLVKQALPDSRLTFIEGSPQTMKITQLEHLKMISHYLDF